MKLRILLIAWSFFVWSASLTLAIIVIPCILFPLALLGPFFAPARHLFYLSSCLFCKCLIFIFGIKIDIKTPRKSLMLDEPALIVINHTSALDIPLVEALLAEQAFVWFSKASYRAIPLAGTILKRMHTPIDRNRPTSAIKSLTNFIEKAETFNAHMLIFPEGTRSLDGKLQRFKQGFAIAAETSKRAVVPIVTSGLHTVLPKDSFLIDSSRAVIKIGIGEPMIKLPNESREAFVERVHRACAELLETISNA
jgi:1-acyl-sn-glycerol-3-phosphate acyltransferase